MARARIESKNAGLNITNQGLFCTMFVALPLLLLALAVHRSACSLDAAPSASTASKTTVISSRLYYRHSLLAVDECYSEDGRNSDLKRAVAKETLDPLLIDPLIAIVAGYGASHTLQFAEELYAELWNGKTDLLGKLYDAKRNILAESHAFWDYLAQGAQPVVGFLHMLLEAEGKHLDVDDNTEEFCCVGSCQGATSSILCTGVSWLPYVSVLDGQGLDSWPQALLDDQKYFSASAGDSFEVVTRVYYLLKQSNVERHEKYLYSLPLGKFHWPYVLRTLHAFEPALLRKFFAIGFDKGSSSAKKLFQMTAPAAMGLDPAMGSDLTAIANRTAGQSRLQRKACKRSSQTAKRLVAVCTCSH